MVQFFKEHPHGESGRAARHFDSLAEEVLVAGSQHFRPAGGMGSQIFGGVMMWMFPKIVVPPKWMVKIMENPIKMDDLGVPTFSETSIVSQRNQRDFQNFRSLYCTDSCCFASCLFVWKRRPDASRSKGIRHQGSYFWTVGARLSGPEQIGVIPQRTWWNQVVFLGNQEGFF